MFPQPTIHTTDNTKPNHDASTLENRRGIYHLGLPVKIMGAPLRSHDSRRWQNRPHLSVSLAYVRDILTYLHQHEIRFYRLAGQLAPYLTHPDMPEFHHQIEESVNELAITGDLARQYGIRLTMHPGHYIQLSSPDAARVERSLTELEAAAVLFDCMGIGADGVIVIHVGGRYAEKAASMGRFVDNLERLSGHARQRIVLENDDRLYDLADLLWIHKRTGLRLVFDLLHYRCHNQTTTPVIEALKLALCTWPVDQQPKIHYSTSRTELRYLYRRNAQQEQERYLAMPLPNQHSDFLNPFEFIDFIRSVHAHGLRPFDLMLEAKAKDLALLRLRAQLAEYAPDLTPFFR